MKMQDIDLGLLRCFVTVAETRSFTIAGSRLGRSQSAISVRVKKLEDLIGCTLLLRNNQDVHLTEEGVTLLGKAKALLEKSEILLAEMQMPSIVGRLRIGVLEYVAPQRISILLHAIRRKLPEAELSFRVGLSSHLRAGLEAGEIDLALALHDPKSEASTVIASDPLVWVEGSELEETDLEERVGLCLLQAPCIYRDAALRLLADANRHHTEILTANSVHAIRNAVMSGLGVSVLGASCLGDGLRRARRLDALGPLPQATLSLHGSDHRKPEITKVLRQVFEDHLHAVLDSPPR
ncbi:MAG: LysR family transcriptional regulator [Pseudomonadota bacterium]